MIGQTVAHYRITAKLGEGGMGEVYRATDTKLDREVAIKVLPAALAQDPERLARFEREAKVLASLNHPNIAQIYGVEDRALIMELVAGETLKGPLPLDTALNYAKQIADALEAAHDKGIVHRDLKPANIKITPDGTVKVLDFGLAKAAEERSSDPQNSPTLTISPTQTGVIMGTAPYMSPEQARGQTVDERADIWAFGVVLYEMLTGERLFAGESITDVLAAVMKEEPNLERVPAKVRRLLRQCLEKDPRKRLRDIGDAWALLDDTPMSNRPSSRIGIIAAWGTATAMTLIAGGLAFIHFRETPPATHVLRYTIAAPEGSRLHSLAISPDGRYLVVAAAVGTKRQLWLRPLNAFHAQPMAFTEDASYPFWSPDSRYIGFFAQGKLKKIAAAGGPAQSLCDAPNGRGGSWSRDNVIVFSPDATGISMQRISAAGGVPVDVFKTKGDQRHPVFLPDGRHFLYLVRELTPERNGIYVASLDGKENRRILADVSGPVFAPSSSGKPGYILFVRENALMAQPFNAATAQMAGDAFPVADDALLANNFVYTPATVSNNNVLLYAPGGGAGALTQIAWYDGGGKLLGSAVVAGAVYPSISPDEKRVVYLRAGDLWLRDVVRGTETRFTSEGWLNIGPSWSPQGDRIVFGSFRKEGASDIFRKAANGSEQDEVLVTTSYTKIPTQWSRDGRFVVYQELGPKNKFGLWVLPMEGSEKKHKPIPFLRTEFNDFMGQLSPDSHWMAYTSDQSGKSEVYVRPFPPTEGQWTISLAGGEQPRWRGDGKELFFIAADGKMMAAPVKTSIGPRPTFEARDPVALFDTHIAPHTSNNALMYDVTADGKRFLITTIPESGTSSPPLNVVVNWNADLKK